VSQEISKVRKYFRDFKGGWPNWEGIVEEIILARENFVNKGK
jgi:hypothetical protein